MSDTPPPEPASETPETRAIVDTFHPGRYREERLLEKCEELEKQRNALSRDLAVRDARVKELEAERDAWKQTEHSIRVSARSLHSRFIHEKGHYAFFAYVAEVIGGKETASDDISEVRWFTKPELAGIKMTPISRQAIDAAMQDGKDGV